MSGLSRTPGKRVWANPHRGFESRPLRQTQKTLVSEELTSVFLFQAVANLVAIYHLGCGLCPGLFFA